MGSFRVKLRIILNYGIPVFLQVDIPMSVLYKCASCMDGCNEELLDKKWQFLKAKDILSDDGAFILGVEGVLTETELELALKVGWRTMLLYPLINFFFSGENLFDITLICSSSELAITFATGLPIKLFVAL